MQQPTEILKVTPTRTGSGRGYLWKCDNGQSYLTRDMANIIGTTPECLLAKYYRHKLDSKKLFVPSVNYQKPNRKVTPVKRGTKKVKTCDKGDLVMVAGEKMTVAEVVMSGSEDRRLRSSGKFIKGARAEITVCRFFKGQLLTRSPKFIGPEWVHV